MHISVGVTMSVPTRWPCRRLEIPHRCLFSACSEVPSHLLTNYVKQPPIALQVRAPLVVILHWPDHKPLLMVRIVPKEDLPRLPENVLRVAAVAFDRSRRQSRGAWAVSLRNLFGE